MGKVSIFSILLNLYWIKNELSINGVDTNQVQQLIVRMQSLKHMQGFKFCVVGETTFPSSVLTKKKKTFEEKSFSSSVFFPLCLLNFIFYLKAG